MDSQHVISLVNQPKRRTFLQRSFTNVTIFDAVDPQSLTLEQDMGFFGQYGMLSFGQIGAALSHLNLWQSQQHLPWVWVLEDDVYPTPQYDKASGIASVIADLAAVDPDWDILYNQEWHDIAFFDVVSERQHMPWFEHDSSPARVNTTKDVMRVGPQLGLVSYIISGGGMKKLLKCAQEHGKLEYPIDVMLHAQCRANTYTMRRPWIEQSGLHFGEVSPNMHFGESGGEPPTTTASQWHNSPPWKALSALQTRTTLSRMAANALAELDDRHIGRVQRSVVICGAARNVGKYLPNVLQNVDRLTKLFQRYSVVFYENDSSDDTLEQLVGYKSRDEENVHVLTEKIVGTAPKWSKRTERISHARNMLVDFAHETCGTCDYVIMFDMDDRFSVPLMLTSLGVWLNRASEWDGLSFNTHDLYDVWALRWSARPESCWVDGETSQESAIRIEETRGDFAALLGELNPAAELAAVHSAFGGFAIYKLGHTKGCRYDGRGDTECEHVPFHACMREINDAKLMVSPMPLFWAP
jgi:GR25 family glycosyltransferase involved in LPS biosynthesis